LRQVIAVMLKRFIAVVAALDRLAHLVGGEFGLWRVPFPRRCGR
jgi:hypothetical protein